MAADEHFLSESSGGGLADLHWRVGIPAIADLQPCRAIRYVGELPDDLDIERIVGVTAGKALHRCADGDNGELHGV